MRLLVQDASPFGDVLTIVGEMSLLGERSRGDPPVKIPLASPGELLYIALIIASQSKEDSLSSCLLRIAVLRASFHSFTDRPPHTTCPVIQPGAGLITMALMSEWGSQSLSCCSSPFFP